MEEYANNLELIKIIPDTSTGINKKILIKKIKWMLQNNIKQYQQMIKTVTK